MSSVSSYQSAVPHQRISLGEVSFNGKRYSATLRSKRVTTLSPDQARTAHDLVQDLLTLHEGHLNHSKPAKERVKAFETIRKLDKKGLHSKKPEHYQEHNFSYKMVENDLKPDQQEMIKQHFPTQTDTLRAQDLWEAFQSTVAFTAPFTPQHNEHPSFSFVSETSSQHDTNNDDSSVYHSLINEPKATPRPPVNEYTGPSLEEILIDTADVASDNDNDDPQVQTDTDGNESVSSHAFSVFDDEDKPAATNRHKESLATRPQEEPVQPQQANSISTDDNSDDVEGLPELIDEEPKPNPQTPPSPQSPKELHGSKEESASPTSSNADITIETIDNYLSRNPGNLTAIENEELQLWEITVTQAHIDKNKKANLLLMIQAENRIRQNKDALKRNQEQS